MSMRCLRLCLLLLLLPAVAVQAATQVEAKLSRQTIRMGDTVTLTVSLPGRTQASEPDFSPLQSDFRLQNVQRSSSVRIINGQQSSKLQWAITLQPRHTGTLTVPPLKVAGTRTRALTLRVEPPSTHAQGGPGDPVFLEVTPSTSKPYTGQQVDLTVKLFYAPDLANGSLDQPQADGLDVRQLGHDQNYQSRRHGVTYNVLERHYALIPQHAGTIQVPGLSFRGEALDNSGYGGFFNQGTPVHARAQAFTLHVRQPPSHGSGPWIPARNLVLTLKGLPADGKVQVGEPITVTLTELGAGVPFETLPEPTLPRLAGAQVYPDQPQGHTRAEDRWLVGKRSRTFAIVPNRPGKLTLPKITLGWWNVVKDQAETASVPAHTLTVTPASGAGAGATQGPAAPAAAASSRASAAPPVPASSTPISTRSSAAARPAGRHGGVGFWRLLALASLGLWMLLVLVAGVWWWLRRRPVSTSPPAAAEDGAAASARSARHRFLAAARRGDAQAAAETLLRWAQCERPQMHHLGEVAAALNSTVQHEAIDALQRVRFATNHQASIDGDALVRAFRGGFAWRDAPAADASPLPPLYPRRPGRNGS